MEEDEDLLDSLLAVASEQLEDLEAGQNLETTSNDCDITRKSQKHTLKETDIFQFDSNSIDKFSKSNSNSVIHSGDTDSSDDEGNRNYEYQKYNECGREIKKLLGTDDVATSISSSHYGVPKKRVSTWKTKPNVDLSINNNRPKTLGNASKKEQKHQDVFLDPIFCMRIVNPKISSTMLIERMQGRLAVRFADLTRQLFAGNLKDKDWVICGVIVGKSPTKMSQKGSPYSIWTLSDLKGEFKTVALFMFSNAHKELGTTVTGTVVGVLNPNVMEKREGSKDEATLSVDSAQKVMIFGQSKDFGICRSVKKNGDKCTAFVNLSQCEFCIYHIKQEYQKCSKRSELQANFVGKGLINLRNKVLGKNEVFYAGKSYTSIPAKKSMKLEARDNNILHNLNQMNSRSNNIVKAKKKKGLARHLDVNPAQRARDLELLNKLGGATNLEGKMNFAAIRSNEVSLEDSKTTALSVISKLKAKNGCPHKMKQYNLKSDLFVNVEAKTSFSGKISEPVSLEASKNTALSVISKLRAEKGQTNQVHEDNDNSNELMSLEEFESELNYSDNEIDVVGRQEIEGETPHSLPSNRKTRCDINYTDSSPKISQNNRTSGLNSENKKCSSSKPNLNANKLDHMTMGIPTLSTFDKGGLVDLSKPITSRHVNRAKLNALKYIERNGPLKKVDPNNTKGSGAKKRNIETANNNSLNEANPSKKSKLHESEFISDRFKKMMMMTSKHADLLQQHDDEEKEKYFNKLEVKERMEEKMVNTHKVKCKAVKCLQCKYTAFSASDLCKSQGHLLKVCKKFNEIGSKLLSRGFIQLEKRHGLIYKRVRSALPRRESERKTHPLARHNDILQAVETRLSMLNMTYMRYIENQLICFIPGKVLDEAKSILDLVESNKTPPRTHQLLQELRDLSSMAIEHFDEHILPRCREQLEQGTGSPEKILKELEVVAGSLTPLTKFQGIMYKNLASTSKQPARILIHQQVPHAVTNELYKMKKIAKTHKHHISYLTQNTQKLCLKLRKHNNKLRIQTAKLREQERKIQEQNSKIIEQDAALLEIKKHMDEWDQKYKDLTAELVRARDEILLKTSSGAAPILSTSLLSSTITTPSSSLLTQYKSNIKPRMAHILPKNYLSFDTERKRKSSLSPEIPLKRNRSPSAPSGGLSTKNVQNVTLNIPDLVSFEKNDANKNGDGPEKPESSGESPSKEFSAVLTSFFDKILNNQLKARPRKRKMTEDIDLK